VLLVTPLVLGQGPLKVDTQGALGLVLVGVLQSSRGHARALLLGAGEAGGVVGSPSSSSAAVPAGGAVHDGLMVEAMTSTCAASLMHVAAQWLQVECRLTPWLVIMQGCQQLATGCNQEVDQHVHGRRALQLPYLLEMT
jgi:hypothetical protein